MADLLFLISGGTALVMFVLMLMLVVRRRLGEIGRVRRAAQERILVQSMTSEDPSLNLTQGGRYSDRFVLSVAARLASLLRGSERERLVELIDTQGLLDHAIAGLDARRASRRIDAIRNLEMFAVQHVISALERVMANDDNMRVRIAAGSALGRLRALPAVGDTLSMLRLEEREVTLNDEVVLRVLAERDGAAVAEAARHTRKDELRAALIEAIAASTSVEPAQYFAAWARDPAPQVRRALATCLSRYQHMQSREWLSQLCGDGEPAVRLEAMKALAKLDFHPGDPVVASLRNDAVPFLAAYADRLWPTRGATLPSGSAA